MKKYELRKRKPRLETPIRVFLYVIRPVAEITGYFITTRILTASVHELWREVGLRTGLTRREFRAYFADAGEAVAWQVEAPSRLPDPVGLSEIRAHHPEYRPPQSMEYMRSDHVAFKVLREKGFHGVADGGPV